MKRQSFQKVDLSNISYDVAIGCHLKGLQSSKPWLPMGCSILGKSINFPISSLIFNVGVREFPGSPVVKTLPSNAWSTGSIPDQDTKVPHAAGYGQNFF